MVETKGEHIMLVVEKYALSRRTIALGRKRKPGCFLGAIVFAMIFASCTDSRPQLVPERSVTKPERRVTQPERRVTKPKRKVTKPKDFSAPPVSSYTRPAWVDSCPKKKASKVYGCGFAKIQEESRANARQDLIDNIAHIAKVYKINEQCHTRYDSTKEYDQKSRTLCDFYTQITTEHSFRGLETIPYSEGDIYYTMLEWDTAPIIEQTIALLKKQKPDDRCIPSDQEESVWEKTPFARWVQEGIGCRPEWKLREDKHKQWHISVASELILVEFQSESESFIPHSKPKELKVKLHRPDRYKEEEGYYLEVANKKKGFLYLFKIDQNGQTLRIPIVRNEERKARPALRIYPPDAPEEKGCTLGSIAPNDAKEGDNFKEFFIAALCKKQTRTGNISNIKQRKQSPYSIVQLLDKIKFCAISTTSHTTGPIKVSTTSTCEHY